MGKDKPVKDNNEYMLSFGMGKQEGHNSCLKQCQDYQPTVEELRGIIISSRMFSYFRSDITLRSDNVEDCVKYQEKYVTELAKAIHKRINLKEN